MKIFPPERPYRLAPPPLCRLWGQTNTNPFQTWQTVWTNSINSASALREQRPHDVELVNYEWKLLHMYRAFGV